MRLYLLLAQSDPDTAHSRYSALIRTLVNFERAAGCVGLRTVRTRPGQARSSAGGGTGG